MKKTSHLQSSLKVRLILINLSIFLLPYLLFKVEGVYKTQNFKTEVSDSFEKVSGQVSPGAAKLADVVGDRESRISDSAGDLSSSGSLDEFSDGKSVAVAGIPSRTVVLGGMDPDTIRKILMDHFLSFGFAIKRN